MTMAADRPAMSATRSTAANSVEKRHHSIFELPPDYFHFCGLLSSPLSSASYNLQKCNDSVAEPLDPIENETNGSQDVAVSIPRWSCNTCKARFESLQDQRLHFKSDIHRFNVKLTMAGKNIVKEEDFEVLTSDSIKDYDVSSISGSEDDDDKESGAQGQKEVHNKLISECFRQKLFISLHMGPRVSIWKCLIMDMGENVLNENEVIERLKSLTLEPRNNSHLRIVLLASGGHFAGCVFDGDVLVAHKTFHRYVVRAKAGKKQSSKDATGRAAHSAGASLRRHNELALKKEIQELLNSWKTYFDASNCIFLHAPSSSRQLLFDGERPSFSNHHCVRNIPMTVRRPTLREAKRVYNQLTQVSYEAEEDSESITMMVRNANPVINKEDFASIDNKDKSEPCSSKQDNYELLVLSETESDNGTLCISTPLHQAAQSGDCHKVLELLENGMDPCIKDERGRTPYMMAYDKEVRNTFRRFMASNIEKWDWHAAKVPSALTKEMEESQAAKQAEKDAKKKARAKELKKLRKAKEKKAQAEAAKNASKSAESQMNASTFIHRGQSQPDSWLKLSKEEELRRAQAEEREKRAAAAERRIATLKIQGSNPITVPNTSEPKSGIAGDIYCSCCNSSLAGRVPFHRFNYKYCSASCMHVHREILEDG